MGNDENCLVGSGFPGLFFKGKEFYLYNTKTVDINSTFLDNYVLFCLGVALDHISNAQRLIQHLSSSVARWQIFYMQHMYTNLLRSLQP